MRAAAYARYSTLKQDHNSIEYQLDKIHSHCRTNDITIVATFTDEAETGTNMDRPGFKEMLSGAIQGKFDAVVIYDISRGSRDVADWFAFRKQMARLGVQVISATQQLGDITSPNDFLMELITVGLGEHQVLDTRQKSIAGTAERAKKGLFCGGVPPLGYDIRDGEYVVNEREAELVRKIFRLYGAGESYETILRSLNGALGKKGAPIGKNSLHSILKNERYIGTYTWNRRKMKLMRKWAGGKPNPNMIRLEGIIPQIIDENTWERVQKRMNDNKRRAQNKAKRDYLLSGLIECSKCGSAYVGHCSTHRRKDGTPIETCYYVCGDKYRTHTCDAKNINANEIETFVVQHLKAYLLDIDFSEVAQEVARSVNEASADLSKERAELTKIEGQINNGVKALLSGMDLPELREEIDKLRTRKSDLEDIIQAREITNGRQIEPAAIEKLFHDAMNNWDSEHLKEIIRTFVQKIYANPDGGCTVEIGVHIGGCGGQI